MYYSSYNVIHAQDINAVNALSGFCKKNGIKLVITVHGHPSEGNMASRNVKISTWLSHFLLKEEIRAYVSSDHIITVSMYSYDFIKKYTDKNKLSLIHNFVDCSSYYPFTASDRKKTRENLGYSINDFVLIYTGRLAFSKGIIHILEGILPLKRYNLKLIIAGDGPEKKHLEVFVQQYDINDIVWFTGNVSGNGLLTLYNAADAFIMSSITCEGTIEGTPMSLLEAMACGLPVITTTVGGIGDFMVNMANSLIIEQSNAASISNAISVLYNDTLLCSTLSKYVLNMVKEDFSIDIVIKKLCDIYNGKEGV